MALATDPMLPAPAGRRAPDERRAIVVGAGVAGLLAARVLVEQFDRVAVVERDALPAGPDFRPGVPQSRHIHALFVRGRQLLERLLPGLGDELVAASAV